MLNLLPKGMIINNIVDTLKKDPENGVIKLLQTAKSHAKKAHEKAMLAKVIDYYATSLTAKMQVRNLVYNTSKRTLSAFAEKMFDALSQPPVVLDFMTMMTIAEAAKLKNGNPVFPIIDLKNLKEATRVVLSNLKNEGQIFFVSIVVTEENFATATSDDVILTLVKHGVRAIFYRMTQVDTVLEEKLQTTVHQIRTVLPILAFLMKKDAPNGTSLNYVVSEHVAGTDYAVQLRLR